MITADYGFIYLINADAKGTTYALGLAGAKAQRTTRFVGYAAAGNRLFESIPGPRPRIPEAAKKVSRKAAGRALCRALGVER